MSHAQVKNEIASLALAMTPLFGYNAKLVPMGNFNMLRTAILAAAFAVMLPGTPSFAISQKDKQATCKFGADEQHLEGAERAAFMQKCMSNKNDPRGPASRKAPAEPKN